MPLSVSTRSGVAPRMANPDATGPEKSPMHAELAEPEAAESADPPTGPVEDEPDHLPRIEAALTAIARQMEVESERAAFRARVIDRLHADVERLRAAERT